jgi:hypothetical protein
MQSLLLTSPTLAGTVDNTRRVELDVLTGYAL